MFKTFKVKKHHFQNKDIFVGLQENIAKALSLGKFSLFQKLFSQSIESLQENVCHSNEIWKNFDFTKFVRDN